VTGVTSSNLVYPFSSPRYSLAGWFRPLSLLSGAPIWKGTLQNVPMIISREMRPKILCLKVDKKVTIPRLIGGDEEKLFVREICIDKGGFGI
jgi:hypothetical protein